MFICGSSSFSHQDEKDDHDHKSPSPKRSKKSNKNPYADRGLDKFYALLADIDNKKRSIYTRHGSDDVISLVRFIYDAHDSNRIKPIVVKAKKSFKSSTSNIIQGSADEVIATSKSMLDQEKLRKKRRCFRCKGSFKLNNLRHPFFCVSVMVFFILLFLAMYGRSFAIMCATIVWYVCPTVIGENSPSSSTSFSSSTLSINKRKPKRKQCHGVKV